MFGVDDEALSAYQDIKGANWPARLWVSIDGLDRVQRASVIASVLAQLLRERSGT